VPGDNLVLFLVGVLFMKSRFSKKSRVSIHGAIQGNFFLG